jgi:hypothetical protein
MRDEFTGNDTAGFAFEDFMMEQSPLESPHVLVAKTVKMRPGKSIRVLIRAEVDAVKEGKSGGSFLYFTLSISFSLFFVFVFFKKKDSMACLSLKILKKFRLLSMSIRRINWVNRKNPMTPIIASFIESKATRNQQSP